MTKDQNHKNRAYVLRGLKRLLPVFYVLLIAICVAPFVHWTTAALLFVFAGIAAEIICQKYGYGSLLFGKKKQEGDKE